MSSPHREFCRRQHRMLGNYLAIHAWVRGLDCLVVERDQLAKFLGLARFRGSRIIWLYHDMKPWFLHVYDLYFNKSFSSVFLSRKPFPEPLRSKRMTDRERIVELAESSIIAEILNELPSEDEVIFRPALWAVGLQTPIPEEDIPVTVEDLPRIQFRWDLSK